MIHTGARRGIVHLRRLLITIIKGLSTSVPIMTLIRTEAIAVTSLEIEITTAKVAVIPTASGPSEIEVSLVKEMRMTDAILTIVEIVEIVGTVEIVRVMMIGNGKTKLETAITRRATLIVTEGRIGAVIAMMAATGITITVTAGKARLLEMIRRNQIAMSFKCRMLRSFRLPISRGECLRHLLHHFHHSWLR